MATSASPDVVEQPKPRKPLLRRSRRNVPVAVWYTLAAFGFALLVVFTQLMLYLRRRDPRDAQVIVERELTTNTLQPGERVLRMVSVFRRNGVDYFRQTRGQLVLTDRRLIYLGVPPRDITVASDAPPNFDQREFRIDTLTKIEPSFALVTPTGRPQELPSGVAKPVRKSSYTPLALPLTSGTRITSRPAR